MNLSSSRCRAPRSSFQEPGVFMSSMLEPLPPNVKYPSRLDGISHPLAESDHPESITPHVEVRHPPHHQRGVTDLRALPGRCITSISCIVISRLLLYVVSLGLVLVFFFFNGFTRVCFTVGLYRVSWGLVQDCFRVY